MIYRLPKINHKDSTINRMQDNTATGLDYIQLSPLTGKVSQVDNIQLDSTPVEVSHGLQRKPLGWIIVDQNAFADIIRPSASPQPTLTMVLQATGPVTVSIIFF